MTQTNGINVFLDLAVENFQRPSGMTLRNPKLQARSGLLIDTRVEKQVRTFCSIPQVVKEYSDSEKSMPLSARIAVLSDVTRDSVCAHLMSDVPQGAFLSSGYDSTSLTAFAAREVPNPLQTITLGFSELKGTPFDI